MYPQVMHWLGDQPGNAKVAGIKQTRCLHCLHRTAEAKTPTYGLDRPRPSPAFLRATAEKYAEEEKHHTKALVRETDRLVAFGDWALGGNGSGGKPNFEKAFTRNLQPESEDGFWMNLHRCMPPGPMHTWLSGIFKTTCTPVFTAVEARYKNKTGAPAEKALRRGTCVKWFSDGLHARTRNPFPHGVTKMQHWTCADMKTILPLLLAVVTVDQALIKEEDRPKVVRLLQAVRHCYALALAREMLEAAYKPNGELATAVTE